MKKIIGGICIFFFVQQTNAQTDTSSKRFKLSGTITITNNGISLIPAYSLGKPAILAFFKLKRRRFSYEPDVSFSYEGRPWGLGNIFRYMAIDNKKFKLKTGTALGLGFTYPKVLQDGNWITVNKAERYIWLELAPSYTFSENINISCTYWNGHNLEKHSIKVIDFVSLSAGITKIDLSPSFYFSIFPQVFYLNTDHKNDGFFISVITGAGHKKIPLFFSNQVTSTITTNMDPDPGFKWNLSLTYILN